MSLRKTSTTKLCNGICRYFAKQQEIGLLYLIVESIIFQYFKIVGWKSNLIIIYERLECSDSKLLSNNHTLSHYLKHRPIWLEFWNSHFSQHLTAAPDILFWEICMYVCIFTILWKKICRRLVKHIKNKNQLARRNFVALKNVLYLMSL